MIYLNNAISIYQSIPAWDAMIALSNDFFKGKEGLFLKSFSDITGCNHTIADMNGIMHGPAVHIVMFDPSDIRSIHAKFSNGYSAGLMD